MKNLHKKICAVALAGAIVIGGSLSSLSFANVGIVPEIMVGASYNSNENEERAKKDIAIFIEEFGIKLFEQKHVEDLSRNGEKVFPSMAALVQYLKENNCLPGAYFAIIQADPKVEKGNRNILFGYNYDLWGNFLSRIEED